MSHRAFLKTASLALGGCGLARFGSADAWADAGHDGKAASLTAADLPKGSAPKPVPFPHFPDLLHAFVWRNWQLVPARRMAEVVGTSAGAIDKSTLSKVMNLRSDQMIILSQTIGISKVRAFVSHLLAQFKR